MNAQAESENSLKMKEPMKIIHKEQDIITAFALNQVCLWSLKSKTESVSFVVEFNHPVLW